ncbi:aldo/keto reductase [Kitasatospora phosalacinea]|uniref:aldo/keto reductase n=1 Tax=Kitasatospora phosalacinea TaxID=2065 RepID=UPI000527479E|nr:aldo/keto reductase [Kitasatospora phosalacinea]
MNALPTTRLGGTDLDITRLGFGAWALGGAGWRFAWGAQDDADSIATVHRVVEAGVNWIDTAPVYGLGHSEEVVGKALAALPESERPYVFTKVGLVWDPADPSAAPRKLLKPAGIRAELEDSLRRLGVERIDLYQAHWPGDGALLTFGPDEDPAATARHATALEEYWATLAELKAEGKVRAIALSNHDTAQLAAAEAVAHVDAIQPQFSLLHREAAPELAWAHAHGTGSIVYQPLHSGLLTGAFTAERVAALPVDDWRRGVPEFTTGLAANLALVDALRPIAEAHGTTVAAVALAWTLEWPGVTGAIVGARRPEQVDGWIEAGALRLTEDDRDAIAAALTTTGAGAGPVCP